METRISRISSFSTQPALLSDDSGSIVTCPRCGRAAMLYLEHDMNVYEHRAGQADETREVCILP